MSSTVLERVEAPPYSTALPDRESVPRVEVSNRACADNSPDRPRQSLHRDGSVLAAAGLVAAFLQGWRERRDARCRLAVMSDRELQDIGLCRSDIDFEIGKPFWRA